ncbi:MAG: class I tRNA ligase family protein, partial [Gammaproteobacteria bacterium]
RTDFKRLGVLGDWDRPYRTMDFSFEAEQMRAFGRIVRNGHLYKGAKQVHWCLDCRSALAEAEVEYEDKTSPAIDVAFAFKDLTAFGERTGVSPALLGADGVSIVIWTTTPWTLPANEAVAVGAAIDSALVRLPTRLLVLASDLVVAASKRYGVAEVEVLARFPGSALEGLKLQHPFLDKQVPVITGDHVTLEAGTGAVHTAPGHGLDDYLVGQAYGLGVLNPVDGNGVFVPGTPYVEGQFVMKANEVLVELLREHGVLLRHEAWQHSYPHCWRHKTPVIFRATPQWFVSMTRAGLLDRARESLESVSFVPAWGRARIEGMIQNRPDWCISRQRTWGVPIALFVHRHTGELHPRTAELIEAVALRVAQTGIDA